MANNSMLENSILDNVQANELKSKNLVYWFNSLGETILETPGIIESEALLASSSLFSTLEFYNAHSSSQLHCDRNGNTNNVKVEMVTKHDGKIINIDLALFSALNGNRPYNFGERIYAKCYSPYGFKYVLDAPISTCQSIKNDKMTYLNRSQFYNLLLYYIPDRYKQLQSPTVKSVIILVLRENMDNIEQIAAWDVWSMRQDYDKQSVFFIDEAKSVGIVGRVEQLAINAIIVYWNPLQQFARIPIAINALSTDFITKDGVRGMPFNLVIDTYEDFRLPSVSNRAYCQIKVFSESLITENTRSIKRQKTEKVMQCYEPCLITEFYSLSDLTQPELSSVSIDSAFESLIEGSLFTSYIENLSLDNNDNDFSLLPLSSSELLNNNIILFIRKSVIDEYILILVEPPTTESLIKAIEDKFQIPLSSIDQLLCKNLQGAIIKLDDDILSCYIKEYMFLMEVTPSVSKQGLFDITLIQEGY